MSTPEGLRLSLVAHVRRLAADGAVLYVRIDRADVARLGLEHGQEVEIDLAGKVRIRGIVKTSGGSPWLAPGSRTSNAAITRSLRQAGFGHGDNVQSTVHVLGRPEASAEEAAVKPRAGPSTPLIPTPPPRYAVVRFDPETAIRAVRAYNADSYRGRPNVEVDRIAYERFRAGLPDDEATLVEMIRFVGEDYGGAQRRFLPHSYRDEAALIITHLRPVLDRWRQAVASACPLVEGVPDEATLQFLLAPFAGTKRWPVWASKTLHFLRPDAFPILDSRAKTALGLATLGSSPGDYRRFCSAFREALVANRDAIASARSIDDNSSPSDLKLLDKILYQLGGST